MSTLAVIGTFYQRHDNTLPLFKRVLEESVLKPDEFWVMCEGEDDVQVAITAYSNILKDFNTDVHIEHLPTPKNSANRYTIIPYSNKINWALDHTSSDYMVFLDNNSMPHIRKYELMKKALDDNSDWGAVFCSQERTGIKYDLWTYDKPLGDAYCILNYTQVMFRRSPARWTLNMQYADPNDLADALFWRELHRELGAFYPVILDNEMLDSHHIDSLKAVGL